jgi:transcriptional regulator with XRE-family HTH domain
MSAFDRILARVTPEIRNYTEKTLDLVDRIHDILDRRGMSQKDLATLLEKQPSEVSRWMTGLHNFEIKTLVKIEVALGEEVFSVSDASGNEAVSELLGLPLELQQEARNFIQYLKHKHDQASAENQPIAKQSKPYPKQKKAVEMVQDSEAPEYSKEKK